MKAVRAASLQDRWCWPFLVHLSGLCFVEALAIPFALFFLLSSRCGMSQALLVVLPLGAEGRNVNSLSVFLPGQLFFCKVRP